MKNRSFEKYFWETLWFLLFSTYFIVLAPFRSDLLAPLLFVWLLQIFTTILNSFIFCESTSEEDFVTYLKRRNKNHILSKRINNLPRKLEKHQSCHWSLSWISLTWLYRGWDWEWSWSSKRHQKPWIGHVGPIKHIKLQIQKCDITILGESGSCCCRTMCYFPSRKRQNKCSANRKIILSKDKLKIYNNNIIPAVGELSTLHTESPLQTSVAGYEMESNKWKMQPPRQLKKL